MGEAAVWTDDDRLVFFTYKGNDGLYVLSNASVLREAGVVTDEKRGQQVIYRMVLPCVIRFLDCLENPTRFPEMHHT